VYNDRRISAEISFRYLVGRVETSWPTRSLFLGFIVINTYTDYEVSGRITVIRLDRQEVQNFELLDVLDVP